MNKPKYHIDNPMNIPPLIANISGDTYLMPGWVKLPKDTKLKDIDVSFDKIDTPVVVGRIKLPNGYKHYRVSKNKFNEYFCECPYYFFSQGSNKSCAHIVLAKLKGVLF